MKFTKREIMHLFYVIGEADGNCLLPLKIYAQKFRNRWKPDERVFKYWKVELRNKVWQSDDKIPKSRLKWWIAKEPW